MVTRSGGSVPSRYAQSHDKPGRLKSEHRICMRRQFLSFVEITLGLSVLLTGCQTQPRVQRPDKIERPNIVFILTDDLGYGDVDALNPLGKIKTPHLRQFATE